MSDIALGFIVAAFGIWLICTYFSKGDIYLSTFTIPKGERPVLRLLLLIAGFVVVALGILHVIRNFRFL